MICKDDIRLAEALLQTSAKCKCGHTINFLKNKMEYTYCSWCSRKVYKDKKKQFINRIQSDISEIVYNERAKNENYKGL